jgi:ankyrin repeat protein
MADRCWSGSGPEGDKAMSATIRRVAGLSCSLVLLATVVTAAAGPDLRLVNAAADQDKAAVRALLKARVDVNISRADGSTALLWAAH